MSIILEDLSKLSINNLKLLGYAFIIIFVIVFLAWLIYMPKVKEKKKLSVLIQGVYRGNFVLFGLAIVDSIYGKEGLATVSLLTIVVIPTFNVLAVIILEYYSGREISKLKLVKQVFKQVFRELYIKTKDELKMDKSRRYAGHQIQPTKSIALLKTRRWVVDDYEGLQKVYYKENIIAKMYAMTDWYSPAEVEAPTIEDIVFYDRKTFELMTIEDVPDLIFSEVMRDIDLVVSVAHVGDVDPEASQSTIEMRRAIVEFNAKLFKLKNVTFTESHALIKGTRAEYSIHLGSGVIHQKAGATIEVLPIHSQHRGRIFLPFIDEDPKTAEIMAKVLLFAQDEKIKDIFILDQIL